ncbi:unnamed protein product [Linum tenue]|uniref:Protein kinase domain-containing protein n=1 Tax=Linum tenue TaxID=586396 RepID=A0AAV0MQP8_9ROSI|nr:unnamed protein product [Linum tenue]
MSLPSSPHGYSSQTVERVKPSGYSAKDELVTTWNKVLESPMFQNKPLLPYDEWNIDFSEITVGTRVGIGFFGEVFRGVWNGTDVAIKVFLEKDLTAENMEDFCNEISILRGLMCIHRMKIVHRDLKSTNCLVNKHWTVKIYDFGLSRIMVTKPVVYAVANEGSRLEISEGPLGRLISDCWAEAHERPSCEEILSRLLDCEYSLC